MERDRYGYVEFVGMQSVPVLFNEKPSFSDLVARAREELHCHDDDGIVVGFSGSLSNQFVFCYEYACMPLGLPHWLRLSFLSCKRTEHDYVPHWLRFSFLSFHFMQKN